MVGVRTGKTQAPPPTTQYYPTMQVVRCSGCSGVGIAEFVNGFSYREGDRLMDGKPIRGVCFRCQREVELVPIKLSPSDGGQLRLLYQIQQSLDEAVRRGERLGPTSILWPLARVKEYERRKRETQVVPS